jgi:hypothetical protein
MPPTFGLTPARVGVLPLLEEFLQTRPQITRTTRMVSEEDVLACS